MPVIQIKLDEKTHKELKIAAAKQGDSMQSLVEWLIKKEVNRGKATD